MLNEKYKAMSDDGKEYDNKGEVQKGGGYYMKKGKLCKMEMEDDKEGKEKYDGDKKDDDDMDKSEGVTEDDLQKSLDMLDAFAKSEDSVSRKEELLSKAGEGNLTDEERDELFKALGGEDTAAAADDAEPISKSMTENQTIQDALDVSDYLAEQHTELVKSLDVVGEEIRKSDNRRHEFNLILAKAVSDIGNLVKAVSERIGVIETQPARAPKSTGVAPLQKSFAGKPEGEQLTKSEILGAMEAMNMAALKKGETKIAGEDMLHSIAKFEQTNFISPKMMDAVKNFRAQR